MDESIEWTVSRGKLLIHFGGQVHSLHSAYSDKKALISRFKKFANDVPVPLDELAELATSLYKMQKSSWGVPEYAGSVAGSIKAMHPLKKPTDGIVPVEQSVGDIIMDLNDNHLWSREKIADWLDTLPEQPVFKMDLSIITAEDLK